MLQKLKNIGPGAIVAAAFIGPGTVTTATSAGAGFAYTLLWAVLFSIIATCILQEMTARLGIVGQVGVGQAIRKKLTHPIIKILASILVVGTIFIGNAAYEAGNITGAVLGFEPYVKTWNFPLNPFVLLIGIVAFVLLYSGKYKLIEKALIVLVSVIGLVFLLTAILAKPNILLILKGLFLPMLPENAVTMVIALIGTTVIPYNLFLHTSSIKQRWASPEDLKNARWDTIFSITFGGVITMAIMITAAIAFGGKNQTVESITDLSLALKPIFGNFSVLFLAFGFLAAGLSSAITAPLAAAFATSEILGWEETLKGFKFKLIWILVLLTGIFFSSLGWKPTQVILFAQVANGLLLPIIAIFLLWVMNDKNIMGKYHNSIGSNVFGILVIVLTIVLGLRGILKVFT